MSGDPVEGDKPKRPPNATKRRRATTVTATSKREEIIRLALALTPVGVIAQRMDIHRTRVSDVLAEPEVRARLDDARRTAFEDARAVLRTGTRRAAERLMELLESKSATVAVRAAIEILSKSGADAPRKFDIGILAGATDAELDAELARIEAEERERAKPPELVSEIGDDADGAPEDDNG